MKTNFSTGDLSAETIRQIKDYGFSCHYNQETQKYELHFPTDAMMYLESEEEVIREIEDYKKFFELS